MRFRCTLFLVAAPLFAQQMPSPVTIDRNGTAIVDIDVAKQKEQIPPETVVATVNGKPLTAGEVRKMIDALPPTNRTIAEREPKRFLENWALFQTILDYAEKNKLENKTPYKERLVELRRQTLVQAQINEVTEQYLVTPEAQRKYYDEHLNNYKEAKGKLILISFQDNPPANQDPKAKKILNPKEAEAKARMIQAKARAGEDFVKLVKEYSDDSGSVSRDGDIGLAIKADTPNIPDVIKNTLLGMKTGDVSDPVQVEHGLYIFKADSVKVASYDEVRDDIYKFLKNEALRKWLDEQQKQTQIKIESPLFFSQSPK